MWDISALYLGTLRGCRLIAAEQSANARYHFTRAEWLRDVVVSPKLETNNTVGFLASSGQHEDGRAGEAIIPRFVFDDQDLL